MRRAQLLAGVVAAATILSACSSDATQTAPSVVVGDAPPLAVEVADTDSERAVGLMGRADVPSGTGMLFVYPAPVSNAFWMGNVEVPLSIAWVLDDAVVGVAEMQPCPEADATCPRYAPDPGVVYTHAVETTGGTFTDADVQVGDRVELNGLDAS